MGYSIDHKNCFEVEVMRVLSVFEARKKASDFRDNKGEKRVSQLREGKGPKKVKEMVQRSTNIKSERRKHNVSHKGAVVSQRNEVRGSLESSQFGRLTRKNLKSYEEEIDLDDLSSSSESESWGSKALVVEESFV